MAIKPEILYFKILKYAYWRLEAVVEVVDRREGDDLDEVALWIFFERSSPMWVDEFWVYFDNTVSTW